MIYIFCKILKATTASGTDVSLEINNRKRYLYKRTGITRPRGMLLLAHRRRIYNEEKAKVVVAFCRTNYFAPGRVEE